MTYITVTAEGRATRALLNAVKDWCTRTYSPSTQRYTTTSVGIWERSLKISTTQLLKIWLVPLRKHSSPNCEDRVRFAVENQ